MHPGVVIVSLWIGFWLSWLAAAPWSTPVEKGVGIKGELPYRIALILGGLILLVPSHGYRGPLRLWLVTRDEAWVCAALIACGLAFAWWARFHLGALWSGRITRKADHRVVDTGPYRIVRHPIYTGILLAVYATAAAKGTVPGLVGALVITLGLWMKARLEETWLRREVDGYEGYLHGIRLRAPRDREGEVCVQVIDNGPGIDDSLLDNIFVPFFTTKRSGTGVGLSLSRQIMFLNKGLISVKPASGGGAEFTLKLSEGA